jgi:hypothetical protein
MGILLVLLLIGGLMLAGWLGLALFVHGERTRKRAEARAPEILDAAFNGSPQVVFEVNMETPSYETVVLGAMQRGYALIHETDTVEGGLAKTLIFQRQAQS